MPEQSQTFIKVAGWEDLNIVHGFGTASFKADFDVEDEQLRENLKHASVEFAAEEAMLQNHGKFETLITVKQIHSRNLLQISRFDLSLPASERIRCDGIICDRPGVLIGIKTADCFPILLFDPEACVTAALHSGWRGTLHRIASHGVGRMAAAFGARPKRIKAAIGPGIGPCCYEVDEYLAAEFRKTFGEETIAKSRNGGVSLDLTTAIKKDLLSAGLSEENIVTLNFCTACSKEHEFDSWRRDRSHTCRLLSVIGIPREKKQTA